MTDLLTAPTARRALACRDIAAVFRILRDTGISQASIGLAAGQRESEVSEILSGRILVPRRIGPAASSRWRPPLSGSASSSVTSAASR